MRFMFIAAAIVSILTPEPTSRFVPAPPPVVFAKKVPYYRCDGCSHNERVTLEFLQKEVKINDKYALATIMGNIKQESRFHTDICEGGARVPYDRCHRGGFGLIQWTTAKRYNGLGNFCTKYNCNPNTIIGQLRYMVNEEEFQSVLPSFKTSGKTIESYMDSSYNWLGWGIHGDRTTYSYQYLSQLKPTV